MSKAKNMIEIKKQIIDIANLLDSIDQEVETLSKLEKLCNWLSKLEYVDKVHILSLVTEQKNNGICYLIDNYELEIKNDINPYLPRIPKVLDVKKAGMISLIPYADNFHKVLFYPVSECDGKILGFIMIQGHYKNIFYLYNAVFKIITSKLVDILKLEYYKKKLFLELNRELSYSLKIQESLNNELVNSSLTIEKTQAVTIRTLARLAEYRDHETGYHLQRICEYTRLISSELHRRQPYSFKISTEYINDIYISSMLHDIGKVGVPDSILLKPGRLTEEEREIMKKHTTWGWIILNEADHELGKQSFLTLAAKIAYYHHERYDGNGYPQNLMGDDIPLSARIEAVADVYDALISKRPYKSAWSHERAVKEIQSNRGTQFDPVIVDIFSDLEHMFLYIKNKYPD